MSTYTDLRNRVRENLDVGYSDFDRITLQKARFYNKENEYWGTFAGSVESADVNAYKTVSRELSAGHAYVCDAELSASRIYLENMDDIRLSGEIDGEYREQALYDQTKDRLVSDGFVVSSDVRDPRLESFGWLKTRFNGVLTSDDPAELTTLQWEDVVGLLIDVKNALSGF